MDRLIYVSKAYIPNFRPLGPLLHVEKFVVVVGGGGGWVCKAILVIFLGLLVQADQKLLFYIILGVY